MSKHWETLAHTIFIGCIQMGFVKRNKRQRACTATNYLLNWQRDKILHKKQIESPGSLMYFFQFTWCLFRCNLEIFCHWFLNTITEGENNLEKLTPPKKQQQQLNTRYLERNPKQHIFPNLERKNKQTAQSFSVAYIISISERKWDRNHSNVLQATKTRQ